MNETLAHELAAHARSADQLPASDRPILAMMHELIGVVPNCYPMLDLWPPGLRTFNLLVPNLLNLPMALVGQGAPKDLVGLAMFASSQAAGCSYCIAHHCSFALRRGVDRDTMLGHRTPVEDAVADLAAAMATVPSTLTPEHIRVAEAHLGARDVESIAMAVALGGFLNKFMDSVGVELEESCLTDVQALLRNHGWHPGKHVRSPDPSTAVDADSGPAGAPADPYDLPWHQVDTSADIPVDSLGTYLRVIRQAPAAVRLDRAWSRGAPGRLGPALLLLEEEIGYSFPILGALSSPRVVRALTAALRDNLDPATSAIGLELKLLAGLVYAEHVRSPLLVQESVFLLDQLDLSPHPWLLRSIRRFAAAPTEDLQLPPGLSAFEASAILLARACAASPAEISEVVVAAVMPHLDPDQIIEIVVWLSLLQTLHRLYAFSEARAELAGANDLDEAVVAGL
ncbi:MAG: carboxymuconolactone decarboxylase family protein [Actinomycetota bacterium]